MASPGDFFAQRSSVSSPRVVESVTDAVVGGSIGVAIGGWKGQLDERGGLFFFFKKKKNF